MYPTMDGYPNSLATVPLLGEDRQVHNQRLLEDSSRIFKDDEIDIEVLQTTKDNCW